MPLEEARSLLERISLVLDQSEVQMKCLGKNDWVVIIKGSTLYYCWCLDDWLRYKVKLEQRRRRNVSSTTRTSSTSGDTVDASDSV